MSRTLIALEQFYETISDGRLDFPRIPAYLCGVCPALAANDVLVISVLCDKLFPLEDLIKAELCFEQALSYPHVALKLHFPPTYEPEWTSQLSAIEKWLARHAIACGTIEDRLFAEGKAEAITSGKILWQISEINYRILQEDKAAYQALWDLIGLPGLDLQLVRAQSTTCPQSLLAEQLRSVELRAQNQHTSPIQKAKPEKTPEKSSYAQRKGSREDLIWGKKINTKLDLLELEDLSLDMNLVRTFGKVQDLEIRIPGSGSPMIKFLLVHKCRALRCLMWVKADQVDELVQALDKEEVEIYADLEWNERFERDFQAKIRGIRKTTITKSIPADTCPEKRVELHIHSKLSAKDACSTPRNIVERAVAYGHEAVAITDHGVVQGFPEAVQASRDMAKQGKPIKVIYGMEGYLVQDGPTVFIAPNEAGAEACHSLAALSLAFESIAEEEFLIRAKLLKRAMSPEGLCGVTESLDLDLYAGDPARKLAREELLQREEDLLRKIAAFLNGAAFLSLGGLEDLNRLRRAAFKREKTKAKVKFNPPYLDLKLLLERLNLHEGLPEGPAQVLAKPTGLFLDFTDLDQLLDLFNLAWQASQAEDWAGLNKRCGHLDFEDLREKKTKTNHIILLASNDLGLYHLYRLVSVSHMENFYFRPRISASKLSYFTEGLIIGGACIYGEVFSAVWQAFRASGSDEEKTRSGFQEEKWKQLVDKYDYLEVQPLANNQFLLTKEDSGVKSREDLRSLVRLIVDLGELYNKPVCATCDSHFIDKEDSIYREIIMSSMGFDDNEQPAPLTFRSTDQMLEEFAYLGEEKAFEVVVTNTQKIARAVADDMTPFPQGSYPPEIEDSDCRLRKLAYDEAFARYGKDGQLPSDIAERLEKELSAVIDNGYAVMYDIAHKLVEKSNEDGYIVGSRGSVGSSVLATFCGISEVNPLPPHYICPHCHYYEVDTSGAYGSGFDLPKKNCPDCGQELVRDGQDIPFATFLGFDGNKQPDIDLNFSGVYQPQAHAYLEELFGTDYTYRAGTINGYAEKLSTALVLEYCESHGLHLGYNNINQLAKGIQGVKVSTGQHPGGIMVLPSDREIYDFTPIQYPANKKEKGIVTTHFDFRSLEDTILKIDALGHDDPTMLKMLSDMTGVAIADIPIPDERVMALFRSTEAIGIPPEESMIGSATIGLPEVGTILARSMIEETKPTRFYDLVQLSGLSHGTGVWQDNAQDLIRNGTCTINEVIGCRDSIMNNLIYAGLSSIDAFTIMEQVRKGRGLRDEQVELMRQHGVPEWYIESCKKIEYLFPKAHAAAYSISTQRVAYFKVYYPEAFYSVWFTIKGRDFSREEHLLDPEAIKARRLEQRKNFSRLSKKEQDAFYVLELVEEMQARDIYFLPLDLEKSHAHEFKSPEKGFIRPPLDAISGISEAMAYQVTRAREAGGPFKTVDDLRRRSGLGDAAINYLRDAGVLRGLPESSQLSLFEFVAKEQRVDFV